MVENMKSNFNKMMVLFSLLFILLISIAMVSAEEIASTDSDDLALADDSVSVINENPDNLDLGSAETDSVDQGSDTNLDEIEVDDSDPQIVNDNDANKNILGQEVSTDGNYTISVGNVAGTENKNVKIVATVKNNGVAVSSGYARFLLWSVGDTDVDELVPVENGQAVLNIKLPAANKVAGLNWLCLAAYYDEYFTYHANTTFKTQIKRAVNPTTILVGDIVGKMGKKVTLTATVYDTDGLKVTGGKVIFTVNGKTYTAGIKNGKASKTITCPFVGVYNVKVAYKGVGAYKNSTSKFKLGSDLKIKTGYYKKLVVKKGAKKFYKITLTNYYTKKALKSFKIKFKVKVNKKTWKTYTLKSNSKGIINWSTKKLSVGTHAVKICSAYKYFKFNLNGKIVVKRK